MKRQHRLHKPHQVDDAIIHIPDDCWQIVFFSLARLDICNIRRVCRGFKRMAESCAPPEILYCFVPIPDLPKTACYLLQGAQWIPQPRLNLPRFRRRFALVRDGPVFFIIGGYDRTSTASLSAWYFDLNHSTKWQSLPPIPSEEYADAPRELPLPTFAFVFRHKLHVIRRVSVARSMVFSLDWRSGARWIETVGCIPPTSRLCVSNSCLFIVYTNLLYRLNLASSRVASGAVSGMHNAALFPLRTPTTTTTTRPQLEKDPSSQQPHLLVLTPDCAMMLNTQITDNMMQPVRSADMSWRPMTDSCCMAMCDGRVYYVPDAASGAQTTQLVSLDVKTLQCRVEPELPCYGSSEGVALISL